jgi:hypothetical protein
MLDGIAAHGRSAFANKKARRSGLFLIALALGAIGS